jgi:Zn-dependent M28 family amino/carboxypeptidase
MPGESFGGPPPPETNEERAMAQRLEAHVETLATTIGERNTRTPAALEKAARYIEAEFSRIGWPPQSQTHFARRVEVRNIIATVVGTERPNEVCVVGAHYDSPEGSPGADDNASGTAADRGHRDLP